MRKLFVKKQKTHLHLIIFIVALLVLLLCVLKYGTSITQRNFVPPIEPTAQIQDTQNHILDIHTVRSNSGIEAWLVEDHSVPVITLSFSFKGAGAINDPEGKEGLAQLASNTMDEGAGDLDSQSFQKTLQDLSISLRFNSSRDDFGGMLKTLSKNKARAFELLKLALTTPRFDPEPVERMKKANQSRIRSSVSDPEWLAARITNDKAYAGHAYARNSGGTLSSLENLTPDDLRAFHETLSKDDLKIAVAGDITAEELKTVLDDIFSGLPHNADQPAADDQIALQNTGQTFLYMKDIPQTIISMTQKGIDRKDPDYHTAQVMNYILGSSGFGSRLTKEIREKRGLTYGIYSGFTDMTHIDTLSVDTSTKNETVNEMLSLIKTEWDKMKATQVTEEELSDAKSYLIGSLPLSLTSTDKISGIILSLQLDDLPVDYLDQRRAAIENVTAEDIQRVAQDILTPDQFLTVMVGNPLNLNHDSYTRIEEINGVE